MTATTLTRYPDPGVAVNIPPIKIQGIKTKLVSWIASKITWTVQDQHDTWIEPFVGSGSVGFNLAGERAIFTDNNPDLIDFYSYLKDSYKASDFMQYLRQEGEFLALRGEEHYYRVRERFNTWRDPRDLLFLNRTGYNGLIRYNNKGEYNVPYGKCDRRLVNPVYLRKIENQLTWLENRIKPDWEFKTEDFRHVLSHLVTPGDFVYLDPPYYGRNSRYFTAWTEQDALELTEMIKHLPCEWALSTWNMPGRLQNPMLSELLGLGATCHTFSHEYVIGPKQENRYAIQELLITGRP